MAVTKAFMGARLRRLREERGLTQVALARALEISSSYLNQLENNQRPVTAQVLAKLGSALKVAIHAFSEDEEAKLITDVRDALVDVSPTGTAPAVMPAQLRELAAELPEVARALVQLHRRYRDATDRAEALATRFGQAVEASGESARPLMPHEEVRDFFAARHNHLAELEARAEAIGGQGFRAPRDVCTALTERLASRHGVRVVLDAGDVESSTPRAYDAETRVLRLSGQLRDGQRAFRMATQLAFLEADDVLHALTTEAHLSGDEPRALARIGLAAYFAGALVMPYARFLSTAERERYDIERLIRIFGQGYETICHRLSTLQRPTARGVPFFFVRVDRAGNISKRQSATDFHFSRLGGTCPLWNVYEAFAQPGRILTQIAQMPDGRTYLWIARTVSRGQGAHGAPSKTFALALGCDLKHAERLVYSQGLDLKNPGAATPIGVGCKVCERPACPQRAFPPIGRRVAVDENENRFVPYAVE